MAINGTVQAAFNIFPNPICSFFTVLSSCTLLVLSELIVDETKRRASATANAALSMEVFYL